MSGVFIKQEVSERDDSEGDHGDNGDSSQVSGSSVPTQRVTPNTGDSRDRLIMAGYSLLSQDTKDNIDIDIIKKFLMTLINFSEGISACAGAGVKRNVISLLVGNTSVPEFLRQLQLITSFPVRPFVLPFLQSNVPKLREDLKRQALTAGCSVTTLMANNDSLLETSGPSPASSVSFSPKASEIFHCEATSTKLPGLKRKIVGGETEAIRAKISCTSSSSMISPPLFKPRPNLAMVPGYPHEAASGTGNHENAANQEDEWKNIRVMLNCISGMVEKTQRAISILQQRQAEVTNVRSAEELVADIQTKASLAIMEVKQAALNEISQVKQRNESLVHTKSKEEACWNCGRLATETCSGCGVARYCGPFCQHKDWDDHAGVCRQVSETSRSRSPPAPVNVKDGSGDDGDSAA